MEIFARFREYIFCGIEGSFFSCFTEKKDLSRFVGKEFKGYDRSTYVVNFDGETPGDILGVNYYDPALTRERLKRTSLMVFKRAHPDRFDPDSSFASTYKIETAERAYQVFLIYRKAYEQLCDEMGWLY